MGKKISELPEIDYKDGEGAWAVVTHEGKSQKADLSVLATDASVEEKIAESIPDDIATNADITAAVEGLATEEWVTEQVEGVDIPSIDGLTTQEYVDNADQAVQRFATSADQGVQNWVIAKDYITEDVVTDAVAAQARTQGTIDSGQDTKISTLENKVSALEGTVVEAQFKADSRDEPTVGGFVLHSFESTKTLLFSQAVKIVFSETDFQNKPIDASKLLNGDLIRLVMSPSNYATYKVTGSFTRDGRITVEVSEPTVGPEEVVMDGFVYDFTHTTPFDTANAASKKYVDDQDEVTLVAAKKYTDDSLGTIPEVSEPDVDKAYVDAELAKKIGNSGEQILPTSTWKIRARKVEDDGNYSFLAIENNHLKLYHVADPTSDAHGVSRGYCDGRYSAIQVPVVMKTVHSMACVTTNNPPSESFCGMYNTAPGSSTSANPWFGNWNADIRVHIDSLHNPDGQQFQGGESYRINGFVTIYGKDNGKIYFKHAITSVARSSGKDYITLHFASRVPAYGNGQNDSQSKYVLVVEGFMNKPVVTLNIPDEE